MLSSLLLTLVVALSAHSAAADDSVATAQPAGHPTTATFSSGASAWNTRNGTASADTSHLAVGERSESHFIFADGFETGSHPWSGGDLPFSKFQSGPAPDFDVPCDLPPGHYVLTLAADNDVPAGNIVEYPLQVVEVPCDDDPHSSCRQLIFGEPVISFR